ncbi:hypothetical protein QTP86_017680 [Hemibagrus guttatus]|nr:hypothetical protein QTP86_017680 [Hemibagrus guttatus]
MCVTRLLVFAILLAVMSHSFGSPVAQEYRRDTGAVLMRADKPEPGFRMEEFVLCFCDMSRGTEGYSSIPSHLSCLASSVHEFMDECMALNKCQIPEEVLLACLSTECVFNS